MTTYHARNPYTGENDYSFEDPSADDIASACAALRNAQPEWEAAGLEGRAAALEEFRAALKRHRNSIFDALVADTGRTRVSRLEPETVDRMIGSTIALAGHILAPTPLRESVTTGIAGWEGRAPYGLVGNITPWNFPLILSFVDSLPALMAGNAVMIKGSEVTPRWIEAVNAALEESPSLRPVLKIVAGTGAAGAALVQQSDCIAFTGSVATGEIIYRAAAERFIPAYLELGGKDPAIVLESADVERAAQTIAVCSSQSAGQACQSLERAYVAESIYDEFIERLVEAAKRIKINYPDIDVGLISPFIMEKQADIVMSHVRDAVDKGAVVECGGEIIEHGGKWMKSTVLTNVNHGMQVMTEETFGPVIPVMPFASVDEAVRLANDTRYGLSGAVFAGTIEEARKVGERIRAGAISINDAALNAHVYEFGYEGFGSSGMGPSRHRLDGLARYTRLKAYIENHGEQSLMAANLER